MYKKQRNEVIAANQKEIEEYMKELKDDEEMIHTVQLLKRQQAQKLAELDKVIINNLDGLVSEQQSTLQILNLPSFFQTSEPKAIQIQMHLLSFILRLQRLLSAQSF
jgi:hypothetical protein